MGINENNKKSEKTKPLLQIHTGQSLVDSNPLFWALFDNIFFDTFEDCSADN